MIVVERATEDDLSGLYEIDHAVVGRGGRQALLTQAVAARQAIVARLGATPVGFAVVHNHFFGNKFIELVVVHPDYRRQGIASALIRYVEKTSPGEKLFTSTNQSNSAMQALCEKLGFVRSGQIDNLDEGDPEIIYFKRAAS
jgi:predicted GNAT family acetyltransferase